jgi:lysophospholipase L1-like esterase
MHHHLKTKAVQKSMNQSYLLKIATAFTALLLPLNSQNRQKIVSLGCLKHFMMRLSIFSILVSACIITSCQYISPVKDNYIQTQKDVYIAVQGDGSIQYNFNDANIVCDGNSITLGTESNTGKSYPALLADALYAYPTATVTNKGVNSQTSAQMEADAVTDIDSHLQPGKLNILIAWELTNSLYFRRTVQQAFTDFKTYCLHRKQAGWKVVVITALYRNHIASDGTSIAVFNGEINQVNDSLKAKYKTFSDVLVDVRTNPVFTGSMSSTYSSDDGVHPNKMGYMVFVYNSLIPVLENLAFTKFDYIARTNVTWNHADADIGSYGDINVKISNDAAWTDYLLSTSNISTGNDSIIYKIPDADGLISIVGFSNSQTPATTNLKYAAATLTGGLLRAWEAGAIGSSITYSAGTWVKITRKSNAFKYYYSTNGISYTLLYSSLTPGSGTYYPCVMLFHLNKEIDQFNLK